MLMISKYILLLITIMLHLPWQSLKSVLQIFRCWMTSNFCQPNDKKTEPMFLGTSPNLSKPIINSVQIGDSTIEAPQHVCDTGASFNQHLNMEQQVRATCKSAWFRLYHIGKIRLYLYMYIEETKSIVHAYVTSRINKNNTLPVACPDILINRIKKLKINAADKLIFKT